MSALFPRLRSLNGVVVDATLWLRCIITSAFAEYSVCVCVCLCVCVCVCVCACEGLAVDLVGFSCNTQCGLEGVRGGL